MSRTSPVAVNIQATSPATIGPPVTSGFAGVKKIPTRLTATNRMKGIDQAGFMEALLNRPYGTLFLPTILTHHNKHASIWEQNFCDHNIMLWVCVWREPQRHKEHKEFF